MAPAPDPAASPPLVLLEELALDPTAFVAPGASVVGRVRLGARASVWFGAVMRGDMDTIALGDESNLQDGAVIHVDAGHPTTVGRRVTIGHRAVVHAATVEDGCLIGMGSIVLTGAVVGAGSLVGAGALVREGQVVPPGSLVLGAPAKIAGQVRPEHTAAIQSGVDHYVALGQAYRAKGYAASFPPGPAGLVQRAVLREGDVHWDALATLLRTTPARVAQVMGQVRLAALRAHPVTTAWSALETLCHLRDEHVLGLLGRHLRRHELEGARPARPLEGLHAHAPVAHDDPIAHPQQTRARCASTRKFCSRPPANYRSGQSLGQSPK